MTQSADSRRPQCAICLRAQSACICQWIRPTAHAVEVVILQHPLESGHAKGSARLLHLSLPRSRLVCGEVFDESALHALLHAPLDGQHADTVPAQPPPQAILLYPDLAPDDASDRPAPPPQAIEPGPLTASARLRLIVLDGTWRKSRKMLYLNPLLQRLPRLALSDPPPSRYLMRKAHGAHQLSTLEATCHALMQLEHDEEKFQPLLTAFDGFVQQQLAFRERT